MNGNLLTSYETISRVVDGPKTATFIMLKAPQRNKGYRGFKLTITNVAGVGTVTPSVNEYDEEGHVIKTWAAGAVGAGGNATLEVYPALNTAGTVYNDILGYWYNSTMTLSPGASLTFSAILCLIP